MVDRDAARALVRDGYDTIATDYLELRQAKPAPDLELLDEALADLLTGAPVLDAGCGAGLPIAARIAQRFEVSGLDISPVQIERARANVPGGAFSVGDMTALRYPEGAFAAVVCLYALFHVPRDEHASVLAGFCRVLRPGGVLLISTGFSEVEIDIDEDWIGAGTPMYWSHYDRETNVRLVREAGFTVDWQRLVVEDEGFGGARHPLIRAHRV